MTGDEILKRAYEFAKEKHKNQKRKGGEDYIVHPVAVARAMKDGGYPLDYQITGYFHDLLEDTDATEEEILALSNERVLTAVKLLTKYKGYNMKDYIAGVKSNDIAFRVKAADRLDNLKSLKSADDAFAKRYIAETEEWFTDFSEEIRKELIKLKKKYDC